MAWSASSSWERWDPNQYIICPYDVSHRILASRFQRHLVKCRQNYPDKDFVSCPFNASHQVLRPHLRNHICSCPDKNVVEPAFNGYTVNEQSYYLKGDTSVPSYHSSNVQDETDEDWDEEITQDYRQHLPQANVLESVKPCQYKSLLPHSREELKRELKQKALANKVNQKWNTRAVSPDNMSHKSYEESQHQVNSPNDSNRSCDNFPENQVQAFSNQSGNCEAGLQPVFQFRSSMTCRKDDKNYSSMRPLFPAGRGRARLIQSFYEDNFRNSSTDRVCR